MLLADQCGKRCQFNNCFVFFCHGEQNNSHETFVKAVNVKGGMALRNGIWNVMRNGMRNDCGMARRIKFRDIFFVLALLQPSGHWTVCLPTNSCNSAINSGEFISKFFILIAFLTRVLTFKFLF